MHVYYRDGVEWYFIESKCTYEYISDRMIFHKFCIRVVFRHKNPY